MLGLFNTVVSYEFSFERVKIPTNIAIKNKYKLFLNTFEITYENY